MRGLNTKSGSSEMSPDAVMPGPSPVILSEAKNLRSWLRTSHAGILVPISAKHQGRSRFLVSLRYKLRHSRDGGNPLDRRWVPAFAGTTTFVALNLYGRLEDLRSVGTRDLEKTQKSRERIQEVAENKAHHFLMRFKTN